MGIFGKIKDAIFGKKGTAAPVPQAQAQAPRPQTAPAQPAAPAAPKPVSEVDVVAHLEEIDASDGRNLNWKTSIVDLMKMLGMESSLQERKELAQELGYTDGMNGSAEMNIWLHKAVMRELAKNGGKVPASMLD